MDEKELLSQLNNLKSIKPDGAWKRESREILLSQISGGDYHSFNYVEQNELKHGNLLDYMRNLFAQPAFVAVTIVVVVLGGGVLSINAARNSKPGDSLYIAKVVSEKAQLAVAFSEESKTKLRIEFAGNRAKEIKQVLAGDSGDEEKAETVEKLAVSLKKEISAVKIGLKKMNIADSDTQIFSANLGRDDKGMQVYDGKANNQDGSSIQGTTTPLKDEPALNVVADSSATSTTSTGMSNNGDIEKVLNEAGELLQKKDYDGTLDKLEKADQIANQIDKTNAAGDSGTVDDGVATSTE